MLHLLEVQSLIVEPSASPLSRVQALPAYCFLFAEVLARPVLPGGGGGGGVLNTLDDGRGAGGPGLQESEVGVTSENRCVGGTGWLCSHVVQPILQAISVSLGQKGTESNN